MAMGSAAALETAPRPRPRCAIRPLRPAQPSILDEAEASAYMGVGVGIGPAGPLGGVSIGCTGSGGDPGGVSMGCMGWGGGPGGIVLMVIPCWFSVGEISGQAFRSAVPCSPFFAIAEDGF